MNYKRNEENQLIWSREGFNDKKIVLDWMDQGAGPRGKISMSDVAKFHLSEVEISSIDGSEGEAVYNRNLALSCTCERYFTAIGEGLAAGKTIDAILAELVCDLWDEKYTPAPEGVE